MVVSVLFIIDENSATKEQILSTLKEEFRQGAIITGGDGSLGTAWMADIREVYVRSC